ncbi:MAG: hypothetical protein VX223_17420 [Myxococcota bacterium]|nr:hypothetical protein [Myxococcota bacterium]
MNVLCVVSILLTAPPSTPVLDALVSNSAAKSSAAQALVARLETIAEAAKTERKSPRQRYVNVKAWKSVSEVLQPAIRAIDPTVGESSTSQLHELLHGAATMLVRDDLYEVQAGLTFLDLGIQPLERLRFSSAEKYKTAIAERIPVVENKTREALVRWLSMHGGRTSFEALLSVAMSDKLAALRALAVQGIARCDAGYCPVEAKTVSKRMELETHGPTRSHWVALAGRLRMAEVFAWCDGELGGGALDMGCRTAFIRFADERAFTALYSWLEAYEVNSASDSSELRFAAALATLGRFSREAYVKGRILKLVDRALSRRKRAEKELGAIAGMLGFAADKERALRSARKHRRTYALRSKRNPKLSLVVDALDTTIQMLSR